MKKLVVGMGLFASIFAFTGFSRVEAQTVDVSQFRQVIELFIALGIISPDKADVIRNVFGITVPIAVSTSTPIFTNTISNSNVNQPAQTLGSVVSSTSTLATTTPVCRTATYEQAISLPGHPNTFWKIIEVPFEDGRQVCQ